MLEKIFYVWLAKVAKREEIENGLEMLLPTPPLPIHQMSPLELREKTGDAFVTIEIKNI